ncbi:MAG: sulfatase-like hydrolase/transferase [Gammaproteobacteria bacterium]|nr:sulfatase-like hydrolase/transferase [Gammaproteobacteria bacterium]
MQELVREALSYVCFPSLALANWHYPLCAPSRFSMMTGRLASNIGAYDNAAELPSAIPTFAHCLRRAGYRTCLSGKMHFIGADQLHGFEERLTTEIYPADFAWLPDWDSQDQSFVPIRNTIEHRFGADIFTLLLPGKAPTLASIALHKSAF